MAVVTWLLDFLICLAMVWNRLFLYVEGNGYLSCSALAKIHSLGSDLEETIYGGFILMCLQTINKVFQYKGNHVFVQIDFFFFPYHSL